MYKNMHVLTRILYPELADIAFLALSQSFVERDGITNRCQRWAAPVSIGISQSKRAHMLGYTHQP